MTDKSNFDRFSASVVGRGGGKTLTHGVAANTGISWPSPLGIFSEILPSNVGDFIAEKIEKGLQFIVLHSDDTAEVADFANSYTDWQNQNIGKWSRRHTSIVHRRSGSPVFRPRSASDVPGSRLVYPSVMSIILRSDSESMIKCASAELADGIPVLFLGGGKLAKLVWRPEDGGPWTEVRALG
jgi:hypothetical protein